MKNKKDIPSPLCPECKKLFGLTEKDTNSEKLRYYENYGTNYGYNNNL